MSTYFAILTQVGEAKLANAIALGQTLKFKKMGVGDGNGNLPVPIRTQTSLVREVRRADLNQLSVDPANASQIIVEQVLPEDVGGWWIREIGIYDDAGSLCAVANCPPSYKPQMVEGSGRTQVVRVVLIVASTAAVELKIDPSVVLATRSYVDDMIVSYAAKKSHVHAVDEILPGGQIKQVLRKKTSNPGDVEWATLGLAEIMPGGLIKQVLRKKTATSGDAEWIDLPALDPDKNLADVQSKDQARKNIGASMLLTGVPLKWLTLDCPSWAVVRDGSALPRDIYSEIYFVLCPLRSGSIAKNAAGAIVTGLSRTSDLWIGMPVENGNLPDGTTIKSIDSTGQITLSANATADASATSLRFFLYGYGAGGGKSTFGVPDDRGLFERALDSGRGYDRSTIKGTTTLGSKTISTIASVRGLYIGQPVSGNGIAVGAVIESIGIGTFNISIAATVAGASIDLIVTGRQIGSEFNDEIVKHAHGLNRVTVSNYQGTGDYAERGEYINAPFNGNNTFATGGPETKPKGRGYLPIIVI